MLVAVERITSTALEAVQLDSLKLEESSLH
jgi:hypothetical protein